MSRSIEVNPLVRRALPALAVLISVACGGGGGDGGTTNPPPVTVATVSVSLGASSIIAGQTTQATATVKDAQNNVLTGRSIAWSSSNTSVATVSPSGVVTGVTAGSATISAASEGKSGDAALTVTPDPATQVQVTGLTVRQNGQTASLAQIAGDFDLSFNLQLPAGFNGVLVFKVDTVEFGRKNVTAPFVSSAPTTAATAATAAVAAQSSVTAEMITVQSGRTNYIIGQDQISELPYLSNRSYQGLLQVLPAGSSTPAFQQQVNFTTTNPPHAHMLTVHDWPPLPGTDGENYTGGPASASVFFANYGSQNISSFSVVLTDYATEYGNASVAVYQTITRNDFKNFTIPPPSMEKKNLTYDLGSVTVDGVQVNLRTQYLSLGGYTSDAIHSGFANTPQQAAGRTLGTGFTYVQADVPPVTLRAGMRVARSTIEDLDLDNLGPHQVSLPSEPVFSWLDRKTTVGGSALYPDFTFGSLNSWASRTHDFKLGLRYDRIVDVTTVDQARTDFYVAPLSARLNLPDDQWKLSATYTPSESNGLRTYVGGARVCDPRPNCSYFSLKSSLGNKWNYLNAESVGAGIGTDDATFGWSTTNANLAVTGLPNPVVFNSTTIDPTLGWNWAASNSTVGIPNGWLSGRAKLNGTYFYGAGAAKDEYQVVSSTGGATSGTASQFFKFLADLALAALLTNTGLYEIDFKGADDAGRFIGGMMYPHRYLALVDNQQPTDVQLTYQGAVVPGQVANGTMLAKDNYAVRFLLLGLQYEFLSSLFSGGYAYVPIARIPVAGTLGGTVNANVSMLVSGKVPYGFWFFNPTSGTVDLGSFYKTRAGSLQAMDFAWNMSLPVFTSFTNPAATPTMSNVTKAFASISGSSWCPGTCAGGQPNAVDLNFHYLDPRPTGAPSFMKAAWFGIPQGGGGRVYSLGEALPGTETPSGGGRDISYPFHFNLLGMCLPAGPMLVFVVGWSADGLWLIKVNPFFAVTVFVPFENTNSCRTPPTL